MSRGKERHGPHFGVGRALEGNNPPGALQFAQWQLLRQFASVAFARRYSVNATGILQARGRSPSSGRVGNAANYGQFYKIDRRAFAPVAASCVAFTGMRARM